MYIPDVVLTSQPRRHDHVTSRPQASDVNYVKRRMLIFLDRCHYFCNKHDTISSPTKKGQKNIFMTKTTARKTILFGDEIVERF